jgi:hypothetical protein
LNTELWIKDDLEEIKKILVVGIKMLISDKNISKKVDLHTNGSEKSGDNFNKENNWSILLAENLKKHFKCVPGYNVYQDPALNILIDERYDPFNRKQKDSDIALKIYNKLVKVITDMRLKADIFNSTHYQFISDTYLKSLRQLFIM